MGKTIMLNIINPQSFLDIFLFMNVLINREFNPIHSWSFTEFIFLSAHSKEKSSEIIKRVVLITVSGRYIINAK